MSEILKDLDDKELYDELHKSGFVEKLETDPAWQMLKEAGNRIVERAVTEFALRTEAKDLTKVIHLQTIIKKYKFGLFDEVKILKSESEAIYEEAKQRGLIGRVKEFFE